MCLPLYRQASIHRVFDALYHRFRRAIAYVNSGKFRVKTESEQQN